MPQVVFVSTSNYQAPRDRVAEFLASVALIAAVVGAVVSGTQSGGILWGILLGLVTLVTFPFLLAFGAILFWAFYPWLAWPGTWLANRLGWDYSGPHALNRIWLQRLSVVLLLIPLIMLIERNGTTLLGLFAGVAILVGLMVLVPILLIAGLIFHALTQSRTAKGDDATFHWTPPNPPRLE